MTACYQLAVLVIYQYISHLYSILLHFQFVRWGSHTLWQVLVCALASRRSGQAVRLANPDNPGQVVYGCEALG
jgi:hypothetical protein